MYRRTPSVRKLVKAGVALLAVPALACSSNQELEALGAQIEDVQIQVLELQKETPNKDELASLETAVQESAGRLLDASQAQQDDLEALRSRIEALETKLDDTNFQLTKLTQLITVTNEELQAVRNAAEAAREPVVGQPPAVDPGTDPRVLYDTAYNDYLQGSYDLSILAFRQYLESFPDTDLADNASYWIGECFYRQGKFQKAIDQFDEVLDRYERSDRTPSALLRKGYAYLELNQRAQGIVQLQNVSCEHGGTDEAHLARQRLAEMGIDVDC